MLLVVLDNQVEGAMQRSVTVTYVNQRSVIEYRTAIW